MTHPVRVSRRQWLDCIGQARLPPTSCAVLLAIGVHLNRRGDGAFPSVRRIAALSGITYSYAGRLVRELATKGWLTIKSRPSPNRRGRPPHAYEATVPAEYGAVLALDFVHSKKDTNSRPEFVYSMGQIVHLKEYTEGFLQNQRRSNQDLPAVASRCVAGGGSPHGQGTSDVDGGADSCVAEGLPRTTGNQGQGSAA